MSINGQNVAQSENIKVHASFYILHCCIPYIYLFVFEAKALLKSTLREHANKGENVKVRLTFSTIPGQHLCALFSANIQGCSFMLFPCTNSHPHPTIFNFMQHSAAKSLPRISRTLFATKFKFKWDPFFFLSCDKFSLIAQYPFLWFFHYSCKIYCCSLTWEFTCWERKVY